MTHSLLYLLRENNGFLPKTVEHSIKTAPTPHARKYILFIYVSSPKRYISLAKANKVLTYVKLIAVKCFESLKSLMKLWAAHMRA